MAAMIIKRVVASAKVCSLGNFSIGPTSVPPCKRLVSFDQTKCLTVSINRLRSIGFVKTLSRLSPDSLHGYEATAAAVAAVK
jgi:hypothetical protein